MKIYEVGYNCGDGIYSVNLLEGEAERVQQSAEEHAKLYNCPVSYIVEVSQRYADSMMAKGMPWKKVG